MDDPDFKECVSVIDSFYQRGGRNLYLEGGEPFLWKDKDFSLDDIVSYAHEKGYLSVVIFTNGTHVLESSADTLFVSIDGLQETHDFLRGKSFEKIIKNIRDSNHRSIYINYTINSRNRNEIEAFCKYIKRIPQIQGVFFYFHTPYYGYDDLYLPLEDRKQILLKLLRYKKQYPILNSRAGLKSALKNTWKRPMDICLVYEKGKIYTCCRVPDKPELCRDCGYLSYAEINQTLKLRPSAIFNAVKYF